MDIIAVATFTYSAVFDKKLVDRCNNNLLSAGGKVDLRVKVCLTSKCLGNHMLHICKLFLNVHATGQL